MWVHIYTCIHSFYVFLVLVQVVPECPKCRDELAKAALENPESEEEDVFAVMKPDIVFFGEQLPEEFHERLQEDLSQVSTGSIHPSGIEHCLHTLEAVYVTQTCDTCNQQPLTHHTAPFLYRLTC